MPNELNNLADGSQPLKDLTRLRRFTGPPADFWAAFLNAANALAGGHKAFLLIRDKSQPPAWRKIGETTPSAHADKAVAEFTRLLVEIGEQTITPGSAVRPLAVSTSNNARQFAISVRLTLLQAEDICIATFLLLDVSFAEANETLLRLQLIGDVPLSYQTHQLSEMAKVDVEKFASTLDLMVLVNAEKRFVAAALALCNGVATRYKCDRVSIGWLEEDYIKLRAISRTERFDSKMQAVKELETAMEEAFDQDDEIVWPVPEGLNIITRDHEAFAVSQSSGNVVSIPLRLEGKPVAVLTCERKASPFRQTELEQLRLTGDQAVRRLADLHKLDRWFGARWAEELREKASKLVGPEHTGAKLLGITVSIILILLLLPLWKYRVEGNFILRSDELTYLTSPFDGYIRDVQVRPGDLVKENTVLLTLSTADLELEESAAMADLKRYQRESEKARASNSLAEMRIAEALTEQVKARLELVRYRLRQSEIKSPFNGVVVEGDLRQRIGSPVKVGDSLFKVARTDTLYVEAEINEKDVHEILHKSKGEIAFVSQPKLKFPIQIVRIEPAALAKKEGNIFIARCAFDGKQADWWRPGMSGLCKIDVERRSLLWVLTHRTIDFLRLKFWW